MVKYPLSVKTSCSNKKLSTPLRWPGGKSRSIKSIIDKVPKHNTYVEPFAGGASLFFAKPIVGKNVINDVNKGLVNFYKELRDDKSCGLAKCKVPENDNQFQKARLKKDTDACAFFGVNKRGYGGSPNSKNYVYDKPFGNAKIKKGCNCYREKLKDTVILNQDYKKVFKDYDSKNTLTYLDPPYWGTDNSQLYNTDTPHPKEICGLARGAKGKVMISYNDDKEVRKGCKGLKTRKIETEYILQNGPKTETHKKVKELLITNY